MHKIDGNTKLASKRLEFFEYCILEFQDWNSQKTLKHTKKIIRGECHSSVYCYYCTYTCL